MAGDDDPLRAAAGRLALATARRRAALAARLGMPATDVLAVEHLLRTGGSTPGELAAALVLTSSGTTAAIQRLARAGLVDREAAGGRSRVVLRPTDRARALIGHPAGAPALGAAERALAADALEALADAADRDADAHLRAAADARRPATGPPVRWG